jgi:hypothetical protein
MTSEPMTDMPYVDRPELQEVFADQVRLIHFDGYSVRLEFAVVRPRVAGRTVPRQASTRPRAWRFRRMRPST